MSMVRKFAAFGGDTFITGDAPASSMVRRVNPASLTYEERADLVRAIRAGEVTALRFKIKAFASGGGNLHGVNLTPEQVSELASSASNADLMPKHTDDPMESVGFVAEGEVRDGEGGGRDLILDNELTDPDAMVRFVQRRLRRFSVSIAAARWIDNKDGTQTAVSPLRIVHNAFISDPAFRDVAILDNQAPQRPQAMTEPQAGAPDYSAQIKQLEDTISAQAAQIKQLTDALDAREAKAFAAELDSAVAQGKILPTARVQFEAARKAMGFDAASALIVSLGAGAALPIQQVGEGAAPPPAKAPESDRAKQVKEAVERITGKPYDPTKTRKV